MRIVSATDSRSTAPRFPFTSAAFTAALRERERERERERWDERERPKGRQKDRRERERYVGERDT